MRQKSIQSKQILDSRYKVSTRLSYQSKLSLFQYMELILYLTNVRPLQQMLDHTSLRAEVHGNDNMCSTSSYTHDDDKSIPFLRRLRDMLLENKDVISFSPGYISNGAKVLGRIIVHDRVHIEDHILPRYFNHSSFASLRRQLNYFNFVRVGKGRQRESTYVNDNVVILDDMLHLKRRSTHPLECEISAPTDSLLVSSLLSKPATIALQPVGNSTGKQSSKGSRNQNPKRRRVLAIQTVELPASNRNYERNLVSEDELSDTNQAHEPSVNVVADVYADVDLLAGCTALLELSTQNWRWDLDS